MFSSKEKAEIKAKEKKIFQECYINQHIPFIRINPDAQAYQLQSINNKHMHLTIHNVNLVIEDVTIPPCVEVKDNTFVLVLSEFLKASRSLMVFSHETDKSKYIVYEITSLYDDIEVTLRYRESDVYPTESKHILTTALDAIYNNTCKGE